MGALMAPGHIRLFEAVMLVSLVFVGGVGSTVLGAPRAEYFGDQASTADRQEATVEKAWVFGDFGPLQNHTSTRSRKQHQGHQDACDGSSFATRTQSLMRACCTTTRHPPTAGPGGGHRRQLQLADSPDCDMPATCPAQTRRGRCCHVASSCFFFCIYVEGP